MARTDTETCRRVPLVSPREVLCGSCIASGGPWLRARWLLVRDGDPVEDGAHPLQYRPRCDHHARNFPAPPNQG